MSNQRSFRKDTLILDLDHTLVHSVEPDNLRLPSDRQGADVYVEDYYVFFRPHLAEFLEYCFKNFKHVILWSHGSYDYVHDVVNNLEIRFGCRFHAVFTRREFPEFKNVRCDTVGINTNRAIFLDDIPERIIGLPESQIYEATPFFHHERDVDQHLMEMINVFTEIPKAFSVATH